MRNLMRRSKEDFPSSRFYTVAVFLCLAFNCSPLFAQQKISNEQITIAYKPDDTHDIDSLITVADTLKLKAGADVLPVITRALTGSKRIDYRYGTARSYGLLGEYHLSLNHSDTAQRFIRSALKYCEHTTNGNMLRSMLYSVLAGSFFFKAEYDSAAHYAYAALNNLDEYHLNDHKKAAAIYNNISGLWFHMGNEQQFITYSKKAEQLALRHNNKVILTSVYLNRINYYSSLNKNTDSAYSYYAAAKKINNDPGNQLFLSGTLNIARLYLDHEHKPEQAIALFEQVLEATRIRHRQYSLNAYYGLANAYSSRHNTPMAEKMLLSGLALQDSLGSPRHIPDFYGALAELYHNSGQDKKAYNYHLLSVEARKAVWTREKQESIQELEAKYNAVQKDRELSRSALRIMQQEHKINNRNSWIVIVLARMVLIIIIFILVYRNNRNRNKLQTAVINELEHKQQITRLQSVMEGERKERRRIARELHDGVGSIIGSARMHLDLRNGKESIEETTYRHGLSLLEDAYNEIRYISHNLLPEQLLENGLIEALSAYCIKVSKQDSFVVQFQHSGPDLHMDPQHALSLFRIVQELLHNASRHGKATRVLVDASVHEEELLISVEDNGCGLPEKGEETTNGTGMQNLATRIEAMGGSIEINSKPGSGTFIYLSLFLNHRKAS